MIRKIKRILNRSIENKEISYKKMIEMLKDFRIHLIDVRSSQEFDEGHLDTAINIPVYQLEKEIENKVPNKEDTIILYCSSGYRSKEGKNKLEKMGYENVYQLKGGLDKIWIKYVPNLIKKLD